MTEIAATSVKTTKREPWNKGKLIGAKPPLQPQFRLRFQAFWC